MKVKDIVLELQEYCHNGNSLDEVEIVDKNGTIHKVQSIQLLSNEKVVQIKIL